MRSLFLSLLLILVFGSGCGAIRSTVGIIEAEKALSQAHEAGAKELAPFPTTLAQELLDKAREEMGYADYSRSYEMAMEAKLLAEDATREARNNPAQAPTRMTPLVGRQDQGTSTETESGEALPTDPASGNERAPSDDTAPTDPEPAPAEEDAPSDDAAPTDPEPAPAEEEAPSDDAAPTDPEAAPAEEAAPTNPEAAPANPEAAPAEEAAPTDPEAAPAEEAEEAST